MYFELTGKCPGRFIGIRIFLPRGISIMELKTFILFMLSLINNKKIKDVKITAPEMKF